MENVVHLRPSDSEPTLCGANGASFILTSLDLSVGLPSLKGNASTENLEYCPDCVAAFNG
jgi:hypothetical protein